MALNTAQTRNQATTYLQPLSSRISNSALGSSWEFSADKSIACLTLCLGLSLAKGKGKTPHRKEHAIAIPMCLVMSQLTFVCISHTCTEYPYSVELGHWPLAIGSICMHMCLGRQRAHPTNCLGPNRMGLFHVFASATSRSAFLTSRSCNLLRWRLKLLHWRWGSSQPRVNFQLVVSTVDDVDGWEHIRADGARTTYSKCSGFKIR
jgi:hypothetical protein